MRGVVLTVFGSIVLTPVTASAQDNYGWAAKMFVTSDGKIPSGHDFGNVPRGAVLQHRFPIKNIFSVPLQISADVSCGCVSATPNPRVLQPHETGYLDITMDTMRFSGAKTVSVQMKVQHPQYWSAAILQIQGFCRQDMTLEPGTVAFGVVPQGQSATKEVLVRYAGGQNWVITGPSQNESAPFVVKFQEAYRQPGYVGYRVQLALKPDAPAGTFKGDLQLATNDAQSPLLPIPYEVTVQPSLAVMPDHSRLGTVKIGDTQTRKLLVRASKPFKILSIEGQGDGLTIDAPTAALPVQSLTLKFTPGQQGPFEKTIRIKTDLDGGATVTAKVEAKVEKPGE